MCSDDDEIKLCTRLDARALFSVIDGSFMIIFIVIFLNTSKLI